MSYKRQIFAVASICLFSLAPVFANEFSKLENVLDKVDQHWSSPAPHPGTGQGGSPPVTPTPQAFNPGYSYMRPGMPYSHESIEALQHSNLWRNMAHPSFAGAPAGQPGGNPFNLSPFGMLHYMWDDTNYVSDANPVTLYQTQSELQTAQHYSQMAQAAASRAHYARNNQEREEAAQQSRYYASLAKQAARQAQQVAQSGSLNPAEVAQAAVEQANSAANYASQATNYAHRGF